MNAQIAFSLAIQALHERKDSIQRRVPNTPENMIAIQECDEAIVIMEQHKEIHSWLAGLSCDVSITKIDPDYGDKS